MVRPKSVSLLLTSIILSKSRFNAFNNLGIIKNTDNINATLNEKLDYFTSEINAMQSSLKWSKDEIIKLFFFMLPEFGHKETGKYLDGKM